MATEKSEQVWQQHVDATRASGLKQLQYSRRHGLTTALLSNWSSLLTRRAPKALVPVCAVTPCLQRHGQVGGEFRRRVVQVRNSASKRRRHPSGWISARRGFIERSDF